MLPKVGGLFNIPFNSLRIGALVVSLHLFQFQSGTFYIQDYQKKLSVGSIIELNLNYIHENSAYQTLSHKM